SEIILPKMDAGVLQVTVPPCANRGPTSPSRARRVKTRHRRSGRGSSGDLSGPKHPSAPASREREPPMSNTTTPAPPLNETASGGTIREGQLEPPPLKLSSSSPDLLCSTRRPPRPKLWAERPAVELKRGPVWMRLRPEVTRRVRTPLHCRSPAARIHPAVEEVERWAELMEPGRYDCPEDPAAVI
ncbi:hypothetical protein M9458_021015, partial [Cirrhinus mrigala]